MTEREKEAASFIIDYAFRLGATLGTWLDEDKFFTHVAVKAGVEAMKPHFVRQLEERFQEIAREASGISSHCGHTTKKEES